MSPIRYIGIDEVGRGAWAGPVVIAAVYLENHVEIPQGVCIRDSKALNRARRAGSAVFLRKNSTFCTLFVSSGTIDTFGVHSAIARGIEIISQKIKEKLMKDKEITERAFNCRYKILIDGRRVCNPEASHEFIVRGDSTVPIISSASIVAKECRDQYMRCIALKFPQYGFEKNVGYGTKEHQYALARHGICTIHRRSYAPIRKLCTEAR